MYYGPDSRGSAQRWIARAAGCLMLAATVGSLAGCATTTSTTDGAEISSDLRSAERLDDADVATASSRAQQYFLRGMTQARLGNHESALDLYTRALQLAPNTAAILAASAAAHQALDDSPSALFALRAARQSEPDNPAYAMELADLHRTLGDAASAARIYREVLNARPHDIDALYALARVQLSGGNLEQAVDTYERLLDELGPDADVQNQVLQLYARLEDLEGMERTLGVMIDQRPDDPQLQRMLAEVYVKQQRNDEAVELLRTSLARQPADVPTMLSLADLYRELGRPEEAEALLQRTAEVPSVDPGQLLPRAQALYLRADGDADARSAAGRLFERILDLDPENETALRLLGSLRYDAEQYADAGDLLYRAAEVNPRDVQLWLQAANAYLRAGRLDRAADVADEGLLLFPGTTSLLRIAGHALMSMYRNAEAAERMAEAVRIIEEDAAENVTILSDLYAALGLLHTRMNDVGAANRYYERALERNPDNAAALNNYAFNLAQQVGDLERALDYAGRAVDLAPDVASYLDTKGWVLHKLGRHEEALDELLRAADTAEASAVIFEHLGDVYDALGQDENAAAAWRRALDSNPGDSDLQQKLNAP